MIRKRMESQGIEVAGSMDKSIGKQNYEEVYLTWTNGGNIKVIDSDTCNDGRCIIYCSGNGLWNPNDIRIFREKISKNDYYEWSSWGGNSQRSIFIRDVLKEWYVNGISRKYSSIDDVLEMLKKYTAGYQVVVVGNSAGGYMASIIGIMLQASHVINICGQVDIMEHAVDDMRFPELNKARDIHKKVKYFNIKEMICTSPIPIFYFYAGKCKIDTDVFEMLKGCPNIFQYKFKTYEHGVAAPPFCYPSIIDMDTGELERLHKAYSGKMINPMSFSYKILKFKDFIWYYPKYGYKQFKKITGARICALHNRITRKK